MIPIRPLRLFTPQGQIAPGPFLVSGILLFLVKNNVDRWAAAYVGSQFEIVDYFSSGIRSLPVKDPWALTFLAAWAVPFAWMGVCLCVKRLRDARLPLWFVVLFFVPFVNLLFFLVLTIVRSRAGADGGKTSETEDPDPGVVRPAWIAVLVAALSGVLIVLLANGVLATYGFGLFYGTPFFVGLLAAAIDSWNVERPFRRSMSVALAANGLIALVLLAFALEGALCLVMAAPLAVPLAALGAAVGRLVTPRRLTPAQAHAFLLVFSIGTPAGATLEASRAAAPDLRLVETSLDVRASDEAVFDQVVTFDRLEAPKEWLFRLGVAYPTHATIDGAGVGATRRCHFSTGTFVEPIEVWDRPRRLAFKVSSNPDPLREWSPWGAIRPAHVMSAFSSERGEFSIETVPGGSTLLIGRTWYRHNLFPQWYWGELTDVMIHAIHRRVLDHIRRRAEAAMGSPQHPGGRE